MSIAKNYRFGFTNTKYTIVLYLPAFALAALFELAWAEDAITNPNN